MVAEAIGAAAKGGVELQALHDLVSAGGSNSVMFERLMKAKLQDDDSVFQFAIDNARKDLRYYTGMAEQLPVASYLAETVHQTYVLAANLGYADAFVPKLHAMMARLNAVDDPPVE